MNIFTGDLGSAERIYINQGSPDEAVRMYTLLLQFDEALRVVEAYNLPDKNQIM